MGVVIAFVPRVQRRETVQSEVAEQPGTAEAEAAVMAAVRDGGGVAEVLAAAGPLITLCRERSGFAVTSGSLPAEAEALASALVNLSRGLALLETELGGRRPTRNFGVYLGRPDLSWFEDGYGGMTGLAVPVDVDPTALAYFVRPRLRETRRL